MISVTEYMFTHRIQETDNGGNTIYGLRFGVPCRFGRFAREVSGTVYGRFQAQGHGRVRRGDACAGAFLICSGKLRLTLDVADTPFHPRILGAGCVVGLPSAVGGSDYSLTAEVLEDAELACVSQKALTDCLRQNSVFCFEVMNILSHEISETRSALKQSGGLRA